jgi:thiol-disulfide isomerase/thioredoxin
VGLLFAALLLPVTAKATPGEVAVGELLGAATLQGLNGPARSLASFRGKPLIINVWASWCGPCREEAGSLERLAWSPLGSQFAIIGISTDDYPENAQGWLRQSNATINHYLDQRLQMENMLGAARLPLTVLIDAQGRVVDKVYGAQSWDGAQAAARISRAFRLGRPGNSGSSRTSLHNHRPAH